VTQGVQSEHDVLVLGAFRGECKDIIKRFTGRIIHLNPEFHGVSDDDLLKSNVIHLGPRTLNKGSMQFYYVSLAALEIAERRTEKTTHISSQNLVLSEEFWTRSRSSLLPNSRFLLYVSKRCLSHREEAFRRFASVGRVTAASGCHGNLTDGEFDQIKKAGNWQSGPDQYGNLGFKFSLVMENTLLPGYVTEKILVAFLSGTVPIYFGTAEIFDIFNRKAFVYYNSSDPEASLELVKHLDQNDTAFSTVLTEDILAPGAIEKYFDFHKTRERIETMWCSRGQR
jgi:hypothetical protein